MLYTVIAIVRASFQHHFHIHRPILCIVRSSSLLSIQEIPLFGHAGIIDSPLSMFTSGYCFMISSFSTLYYAAFLSFPSGHDPASLVQT